MDSTMSTLKSCPLFKEINENDLIGALNHPSFRIDSYIKGQAVFEQDSLPKYLFVLVKGSVNVCKDDINGKRNIVNTFQNPGTVFGEVYLYLATRVYDYSCYCIDNSVILRIDKSFLKNPPKAYEDLVNTINWNMLTILSEKAFYLNQKLLIHSSYSLRQKISNYILQLRKNDSLVIELPYNREELAEYLAISRPSLSRELSNMEADGLIEFNRSKIFIKNLEKLENQI